MPSLRASVNSKELMAVSHSSRQGARRGLGPPVQLLQPPRVPALGGLDAADDGEEEEGREAQEVDGEELPKLPESQAGDHAEPRHAQDEERLAEEAPAPGIQVGHGVAAAGAGRERWPCEVLVKHAVAASDEGAAAAHARHDQEQQARHHGRTCGPHQRPCLCARQRHDVLLLDGGREGRGRVAAGSAVAAAGAPRRPQSINKITPQTNISFT